MRNSEEKRNVSSSSIFRSLKFLSRMLNVECITRERWVILNCLDVKIMVNMSAKRINMRESITGKICDPDRFKRKVSTATMTAGTSRIQFHNVGMFLCSCQCSNAKLLIDIKIAYPLIFF